MPPKAVRNRRGRGAARAGEGGPSRPDSGMQVTDTCGLCSQEVGENAIGCDLCSDWFHPHCSGLSDNAARVILTEGGDALAFKCSACLNNNANSITRSNDNSDMGLAIKQLFEIVKSLSVNMANLVQNVQTMTERLDSTINNQVNNSSTNATHLDRKNLYVELFEFEERKKRTKSIIVRGIEAEDDADFGNKFGMVCNFLMPESNAPSGELFCIDREKKMYRVTLNDKKAKVSILDNSKKLKDHPDFSVVFISPDLTFMQRQEAAARRMQVRNRRQADRSETPPHVSEPNNIPVGQAASGPPRPPGAMGGNFH